MSRLKGFVFPVVGVVAAVPGLGQWDIPETSRSGFIRAWSVKGDEVLRLREDPFSNMATAVPEAGAVTADHGVRRVVRG